MKWGAHSQPSVGAQYGWTPDALIRIVLPDGLVVMGPLPFPKEQRCSTSPGPQRLFLWVSDLAYQEAARVSISGLSRNSVLLPGQSLGAAGGMGSSRWEGQVMISVCPSPSTRCHSKV
jgi:hypothetical protein